MTKKQWDKVEICNCLHQAPRGNVLYKDVLEAYKQGESYIVKNGPDSTIQDHLNNVKPILKGLKSREAAWFKKHLEKIIVGVVIGLILLGISLFNNRKTDISHKGSVLYEINFARNMLDYTLLQRQQNIRTRPNFNLAYRGYIPDSFADNLSLKTELDNLYQSLLSVEKSAMEFMFLLSQDNSDPLKINNLEAQIERVIELADKVGLQVANHIDKTWQIPPTSMSQKEKIQYYENELNILNSTATDTVIIEKYRNYSIEDNTKG